MTPCIVCRRTPCCLRRPLRQQRNRGYVVALVASAVLLFAPALIPDAVPERVALAERVHHAIDPNRAVPPSEALLGCIRKYETGGGTDTRGNYASNGRYKGAYQFDQRTWDAAARSSVHTDWYGRNPATAPHEIQDSMASHLYRQRGLQPWPTPKRKCRP